MLHRTVAKKFNLTQERLRDIFTCTDTSSEKYKVRKKFEERIMSRLNDGILRSMKPAKYWQAVDLAWDSHLSPVTVPLLQWAQGLIDMRQFSDLTKNLKLGPEMYIKEDDGSTKLSLPKIREVSVNLIRSYVTRRVAAQSARFANLWPFFKYEPRGNDEVSRLIADVTSQRVDTISDSYNYRHLQTQVDRHKFMYGRSVLFPRSSWDIRYGWRAKDPDAETEIEVESFVEKEGLDFSAPHPSRVYYDTAAPLANINTNNGPRWIGYWDIVRFRELEDGGFFNLDAVSMSDSLANLVTANSWYFQHYFDPAILSWPEVQFNPSLQNERNRNVGKYDADDKDRGCFVSQHFELVNPKQEGLCDLDCEVWLRFTVAGDNTILGCEPMPSIPACYGGFNENDDREYNISMAMELMPFQDQLTNLFTELLDTIKLSLVQIWAVDKDIFDRETQKAIEDAITGGQIYNKPHVFTFSGTQLSNNGIQNPNTNPRAAISLIQANLQTNVSTLMDSIFRVLALADRIVITSPNEIGQPIEKTTSASEATIINSTMDAMHSFVSDGTDEQRAAMKRLIYESLVCCSTQKVTVPVMNRYRLGTITAAGFKVPDIQGEFASADRIPERTIITGPVSKLIYEFIFDSRDGAERFVNQQGAQILSTMLGQALQSEIIAKKLGAERIFDMWNVVLRMSGAPYDLQLDKDDGESDAVEDNANLEQRVGAIEAAIRAAMGGGQPQQTPEPAPAALFEPQ